MALSIAGSAAIVSLYAAPQEAAPAFEVASIKRDIGGEHINYRRPFPTLHVEGSTLKDLVISAYQVHDFQVTGGPVWIDSDLYNIDAKAEAHPVANQQFVTLQRRRLQTLLRDRFHLTIHRETKELPVYELTVAKGGPKLQPSNCVQRVTWRYGYCARQDTVGLLWRHWDWQEPDSRARREYGVSVRYSFSSA